MLPLRLALVLFAAHLPLVRALKLVSSKARSTPCLTDEECRDYEESTCTGGRCVCAAGAPCYARNFLFINRIGEKCDRNGRKCVIAGSECRNDACACIAGYESDADGKRCVKEAEVCVEAECNVEECVRVGANCLPVRFFDGKCYSDLQCERGLGEGAHCHLEVCKCEELYHFDGVKCRKDYLLNEVCGEHRDCHQPGEGSSRLECLIGNCKCRQSFSEVGGYCVESASNLHSANLIACLIGCLFAYYLF